MTSPTQVALRELMILTKCYCDGEHPRLGHNCSFRRDVETLVAAVARVLKICEDAHVGGAIGDWPAWRLAEEVHAALLGTAGNPPAAQASGESKTTSVIAQVAQHRAVLPGEGGPPSG